MKLMLPLIGLFIVLGLSATAFNRRVYGVMVAGIMIVAVAFFVLWFT